MPGLFYMLVARVSVAAPDEVEGIVSAGGVHHVRQGPDRTLKIEVRFAGVPELLRHLAQRLRAKPRTALLVDYWWLPLALLLVCGAFVCGAAFLQRELSADIIVCWLRCEGGTKLRPAVWWLLPLAFALLVAYHGTLCVIYVVLLHPHEQFPYIQPKVLANNKRYVLAIRVLGHDAWRSMFGILQDRSRLGEVNIASSADLIQGDRARPMQRIPWDHYWSLIRFCVGRMLPSTDADREFGKAAYFTFKQRRLLVKCYLALLGLAIFLPMCGKWPEAWPALKQILAAAGLMWAFAGILIHRRSMKHLEQWELVSRSFPFRGSPLFLCSATATDITWEEIRVDEVEAPIFRLGLNYSQMYQIILTIFLGIFLTALQLIS